MRRSIALLPFAALTIAAAIVAACEEDIPLLNGIALADASIDVTNAGRDSSPLPDASAPDAAPLPVTVNVTDSKGPKAGVLVVFHDATGAVLESRETGADGKATSTGVIPAMASALVATGGARNIMTWTGVEAGDELLYRDPSHASSFGSFDVSLPEFTLAGSPMAYTAHTGECGAGSDGRSISYLLYEECVRATNAVLGRVFGTEGAGVIGYSTKKGQSAPADGGTVAIATEAWAAPGLVNVTIANAPSEGELALGQIADGVSHSADPDQAITGGRAFRVAAGFADALQPSFTVGNGGAWRGVAKRGPVASTLALDFASALPELTDWNVNTPADVRRPVITWTADGSTSGANGGVVRLDYHGPEDANYRWTFVVAPGQTSVTAPAMPNNAWSFLPDADAGAEPEYTLDTIGFAASDRLNGYTLFRRQEGVVNLVPRFSFPTLPVDGLVRVTVRHPESG